MARIEEQQKAIFSLKTNLMDDLNEKGLLSDPECQRVLEQHQRDQAVLSEKLDSQRAKQERVSFDTPRLDKSFTADFNTQLILKRMIACFYDLR